MKKIIIVLSLIVIWLVAQHYLFKWIDKENNRVECIPTINSNCV